MVPNILRCKKAVKQPVGLSNLAPNFRVLVIWLDHVVDVLKFSIPERNVQDKVDTVTPVRGSHSIMQIGQTLKNLFAGVPTRIQGECLNKIAYEFLVSMIVRAAWNLKDCDKGRNAFRAMLLVIEAIYRLRE